jgi:putative redox protein
MKYILDTPIRGTIGVDKYKTAIHWRNGVLITDEPEKIGGKDLGPDPYSLLLSSLIACTLATLRMYIDLKGLQIEEIQVEANLFQKLENMEIVTWIERRMIFANLQGEEISQRLIRVAENCPVSKILKGSIKVTTVVS